MTIKDTTVLVTGASRAHARRGRRLVTDAGPLSAVAGSGPSAA